MSKSHDNSPMLGKYMIVAAWIIALVLLTLLFNDLLEQQHNPNRTLAMTADGEIPSVQLKRNRSGHYVATGTINGQPVEFMLDTGATDVSIPVAIADRLDLERGRPAVYQTANGPITAWRTTVREIRLGPVAVGPVSASINPADTSGAILLGMSFLRHLDFSQQGNTLTLSYPRHGTE